MKRPVPVSANPRPSVAIRFGPRIEQAASSGIDLDDLALHLTFGDVDQLKRDRSLPVADISFVGGVMTYLGVKVVKGGVPTSVLRHGDVDAA